MKLLIYIVFVLLLTCCYRVTAQSNASSDSIALQGYLDKAQAYSESAQYDSAISILEEAFRNPTNNTENQLQIYILLGKNYTSVANYTKADRVLRKGISEINNLMISEHMLSEFHLTLAQNLAAQNKYDEAIGEIEKSLKVMKKVNPENNELLAQSYNQLGFNFRLKGMYDTAMFLYNKELSIYKNLKGNQRLPIAQNNYDRGWVEAAQGNIDIATDLITESLRLRESVLNREHPLVAESVHLLGWCHRQLADYQKAKDFYLRALDITISTLGPKHPDVATSYHALGNLYHQLGEYDQALTYHLRGNRIWIDQFGEYDRTLVRYYNFLAVTSKMINKLDDMRQYLDKAILVASKLEENHPELVQTHRVLADYYYLNGDKKNQIKNLQKALEVATLSFGKDHYYVALVTSEIGEYYRSIGVLSRSMQNHQTALELYKGNFGEKHPEVAGEYLHLGDIYSDLDNNSKALDLYQKGMQSVSNDFSSEDPAENPPPKNIVSKLMALKILERKANTLRGVENLEASLRTFELAIGLLDDVRLSYTTEESRQSAFEGGIKIFEGAVKTTWELWKSSGDNNYIGRGFIISERSKAFILLHSQNSTFSKVLSFPDSLRDAEQKLKVEIAYFTNKLIRAQSREDEVQTVSINNQLFDRKEQHRKLLSTIESDYPEFYKLKYSVPLPSIRDMRDELLDEETGVIEYFETKNDYYVFVVTKRDLFFDCISKPENANLLVSDFRRATTDYELLRTQPAIADNLFMATSYLLYRFLLEKPISHLSKGISNLILITDGGLRHLNFEAFLTDKIEGKPNYTQLPYLLNKYEINYAYSANILVSGLSKGNKKYSSIFGGFAPEFSESLAYDDTIKHAMAAMLVREGKLKLPGAKEEVVKASQLLNGDSWLGTNATEKKFKEFASEYQILHLATHGLLNDKNPMLSELLFTPIKDSINDGFLNINEIYNLKLNADLVVLSACNTGYGEIQQGEGNMSLSRAFRYAGCPSVIMSLWKVPDEPTKNMMVSFYQNLYENQNVVSSLQKAKLDYIQSVEDPIYAHPYYWAGFVLMGEPGTIELDDKWPKWLILSGGIFSLLLVGLFFRKKLF